MHAIFILLHFQVNTMDNETLKLIFKHMHKEIVREVNPDTIIDKLVSRSIISYDDYYYLYQAHPSRNRCHDMLSLLYRSSHPEAFIHLRLLLSNDYLWICDEIDELYPKLIAQQKEFNMRFSADGKCHIIIVIIAYKRLVFENAAFVPLCRSVNNCRSICINAFSHYSDVYNYHSV